MEKGIFKFLYFSMSCLMLANSFQLLDDRTCRESPFVRTLNQPPSILFHFIEKNGNSDSPVLVVNQSICFVQIKNSSHCKKSTSPHDAGGQCDLINCDPYQFNETHNGVIITSTRVLTEIYHNVTLEGSTTCDPNTCALISLKNCSFKSVDSYTEISEYSVSYGQSTKLTCVNGSKLVQTPNLIDSNFAHLTCGNCSAWITKPYYCVIVSVESRDVYLEGDRAEFNCTTNQPDAFQNKSLVFYLNGLEISSDDISKIHLNSDNNGNKVYCIWHLGNDNESDFLSSKETTINVTYAPKNVSVQLIPATPYHVYDDKVYLNLSQTVSAGCYGSANPDAISCTWFVNNENTFAKCFGDFPVYTSSNVFCNASNNIGSDVSKTVEIIVVETRKVNISTAGYDKHQVEGKDLNLLCNIPYQKELETKFQWTIPNNMRTDANLAVSHLMLSNLTLNDKGTYRCETIDTFGTYSSTADIDVFYAPETLENNTNCSWKDVEDSNCYVIFTANPRIVNYSLTREETLISCPDCKLTSTNESLTQKFVLVTYIRSGSTNFKLYLSAALDFPDLRVTFKISDEIINYSFINIGLILGCVLGISSVLMIILGVLLFRYKDRLCKDSKKVEENFDVVDIDTGSHVYQNNAATNSGSTEQKQDNYENVESGNDPEHHYETEIEYPKYENYRNEKAEENKYEEMRPSK